jgi:N6-adenosine-specific RNA methylase IME4
MALVRYDAMCSAIEAAHSVDEAKGIRDKAIAMEAYFRQAKNRDNERKAERIRLRAERRSGELLVDLEKAKAPAGPGRGKKGGPVAGPSFNGAKTLADRGISKNQSAHWQKVAQVPKTTFEAAVESAKPTVAVNNFVKKHRRAEREGALATATHQASERLGAKLYSVLYADPPWRFKPYSDATGMDRAADNHYPTMTIDKLFEMKVPAADDCVLFLWATVPMLPEALTLMQRWGFTYKSHFIWRKDKAGTGYWNRNQHELLLVGTRGNIPAPAPGDQYSSVIEALRDGHSSKPPAFAEMIDEMFPTSEGLELFARGPRLGWDVWGNEVP